MLDTAGFTDIRWGEQIDVFSGSKHESDAQEFETRGVTLSGVKPLEKQDTRNEEVT